MNTTVEANIRPPFDDELQSIADYVLSHPKLSDEALQTAQLCLMDTLGCGMLALKYPECRKLLGPVVEGTQVPLGARVPGTAFRLDPIKAAWDIGCMVRWLDFNDTWLAAEWGHPSDNLGAILAVTDWVSQQRAHQGKPPLTMQTVLEAMIKAHEIQGVLALENSFNAVGLDHVVLVKVASTAVASWLLGGTREQIINALSHAWVDGQALRTYRHAPNAGSRKSWAAGDATSRAVHLALISLRGEMGIPTALSAPKWGFYEVSFGGQCFSLPRDFGCYVMENVLFKLQYPAEFHAQTACEAGVILHSELQGRFDEIEKILITTHESAIRIISKEGDLANPADRDHCLQYMTALALLFGDVTADFYEDEFHQQHPEIDELRAKMEVVESKKFSKDYLDPSKRSIANAIQVFFKDRSCTEVVTVEYPIGHRRRREESIPVLKSKFKQNLASRFPAHQVRQLIELCEHAPTLVKTPVHEFVAAWYI